MINRLAIEQRYPVINIVRKEDQAKILRDMGAEHVLNSSDSDFWDKLVEISKKLRATVCLEAIGGAFTG